MFTTEKIAFELLEDAEEFYNKNSKYNLLQSLHLLFGSAFFEALELLERPKIARYETSDSRMSVYTIRKGFEENLVFRDINFCTCDSFKSEVLESQRKITCKHVLAVKIGEITGKFTVDKVSPEQYAEFLENELLKLKDDPS